MVAYYNENDAYAAQWLRNLIAAGHIAPGDVDERDIRNVRADDLRGYAQCHFFAGIGGWSIALRLAGWPDDRPVWTGSCPCQPFSAAGKGKAADDERHLWPAWFSLIAECRPAVVFGEQVEAAIGWGWLDAVFADLEGEGYACGAAVLPACGVGAPHIRQRLWFVAYAQCGASEQWRHDLAATPSGVEGEAREWQRLRDDIGPERTIGKLADRSPNGRPEKCEDARWGAAGNGAQGLATGFDAGGDLSGVAHPDGRHPGTERLQRGREQRLKPQDSGAGELGDSGGNRRQTRILESDLARKQRQERDSPERPGALAWADCDWLPCTDGKARPVEPGTFPLAHGIPRRASKLRAYGNAIVPQVAAEFIAAADEAILESNTQSQLDSQQNVHDFRSP